MITDIGIANGIVSVILNYARAMPDDIRFDVLYFADREQNRQADIEALGGRVYKINPPSLENVLKREIKKFFNAHKGEWESLHINAPHFTAFIAPPAKMAGIKKICCHCHSTLYSLNPKNIKRNEILSKIAGFLVDKRFACSKAAGDYWYGKNYTVLKNAIDCVKFIFNESTRARVRADLELTDNLVIGHIGRTDIIQKNHPFLLKIFSEIEKQNKNARLLLIGAEQTEKINDLCNEYGITDKVIFIGFRNDVNELLQAVDEFLFPSTNEGLPVSVIEAQTAGLPVLMSDSITEEAIVTNETATLSLNESPNFWAEKAIEMSKLPRKDNFEIMKSAGWNIFDSANELIKFYKG